MNSMTPNDALLIMWITFTTLAVVGVSGGIVWAVRSRQFANQDRARYLPLMSGIPGQRMGGPVNPDAPELRTPEQGRNGGAHVPA